MVMSGKQAEQIEDILKGSIRNKLANYNPEPAAMPFHTRLLGESRLALYSFIHSLNTNFGTTIFEPVALVLADSNFRIAKSQVKVGDKISKVAQSEIQCIMDGLTTASSAPDKQQEVQRIREVAASGEMVKAKPTKADLMLESDTGELFMFDLKTAKPNAGNFKGFKRTLLEWVAVTLAQNPNAKVNTLIAIPYNPYEPKPYSRWTIRGMLDLEHELKVGDEFWNFLAGGDAYEDLLGCFERVGMELKDEIDESFKSRFNEL